MKRFYKQVAVEAGEAGWQVLLDGRPVRTPAKALLCLPNADLAQAVAAEWEAQADQINPRAMPMTGLANAAIDRIAPNPARFAASLAAFAESELLCYRAPDDQAELAARQEAEWGAILGWARQRYDVSFTVTSGIIHQPQPPETLARLGEAMAAQPVFALAPLSPIITISGSCVIGLALAENAISADAAFDAAHLDELWQAEQWGEDDLALATRAARRAEMMAAVGFLELVSDLDA